MSTEYRRIAAAFAAVVALFLILLRYDHAHFGPRGGRLQWRRVAGHDRRAHQRAQLYLVLGEGRALRYPVGVGRVGRQWAGRSHIDGKHIRPAWAPPADIRRDSPNLPSVVPGGSPQNPMGAAALTLSGGDYAIHGTNNPGSIGGFVSYGCIRMHNQDIVDLYARVGVGTPVVVTR